MTHATTALAFAFALAACAPPQAPPSPPPPVVRRADAPPAPPRPEPTPLRYELVGEVPAAEGDVIRLFPLQRHVAAAFMGTEPDARPRVVVSDGEKLVTSAPFSVPDKGSFVLEMAGDWPARVDVVLAGRKAGGELHRGRLGYRLSSGRWSEQEVGWQVSAVGDRVVTTERRHGRTAIRALQGAPLPRLSLTPRAKGACEGAANARDVALVPRVVVSRGGAGLATVGEACDGQLGVELFPSGGGEGTVYLAEEAAWGLSESMPVHVAARGAEIWAAQMQDIRRFDGRRWETIAMPAWGSAVSDVVVDGEGTLWLLLDHASLAELRGDRFIEHPPPPGPHGVEAVVVGPDGGLVALWGKRLVRVLR